MTTEANVIPTFADFVRLLERDGVFHKTNLAELTVEIPTQRGTLDSVMLVRWQESDGVIQFIQALPLEVPDAKVAVLADAVTRLNHVLAIPGFDVNHGNKILAYRLYLPLYPRGAVLAAEIQSMFQLTVKTAADMLPVLKRVAAGQVAAEEVVADAQREYAALAAAQAAQAAQAGQAPPTPAAPQTPPSTNMY